MYYNLVLRIDLRLDQYVFNIVIFLGNSLAPYRFSCNP